MEQMKILTLENAALLVELTKGEISVASAKALKTVTLEGNTLKFYREEEPVGDSLPAYTLELPETDLSGLIPKLTTKVAGNVAMTTADGTITDGGVKVADIATKAEVKAVSDKADANETAINAINNESTGILAQAKTYADGKDAAIQAAKDAADAAQSDVDALTPRVSAVEGDITTLKGTGEGSIKKQIDDAFNDFATKVSDDNVVNTFKELVDYCATHSADAAEMAGDISANADAIAKLETFVGTLPEGTSAKTVIEYINAKVAAVDFSDEIATAKQEAIDAAAADATAKANQALSDAKDYTDTKNNAMDGRMTTVEGKVTTLETAIAEGGSVDLAIKDAKKAGTDAATAAAKAQTDVNNLTTTVSGINTRVGTNETNIGALQTASSAQADRITALETKVGAGFRACEESEIRALFA